MNTVSKVELAILIVVALAGAIFYYEYSSRVYGKCVVELGNEVQASDFLKDSSKDAEFLKGTVINTSRVGVYPVEIRSSIFTYDCALEVDDTVAPELTVKNLVCKRSAIPEPNDFVKKVWDLSGDINIYYGDAIFLDNYGDVDVKIVAEDGSGNRTVKEAVLTIEEDEATIEGNHEVYSPYSEEAVFDLAGNVLSEIITDDMTDYEKAEAIFRWVKTSIIYSESTIRNDWLKGAYEGLATRHGDCYSYYSVSKALLTCAGIKNEDIEIIPTTTRSHYWNVVDCGEGWRHFDATPRVDKGFNGFYLTDEELREYSVAHNGTHNYNRDVYSYFQPTQ